MSFVGSESMARFFQRGEGDSAAMSRLALACLRLSMEASN